MYAFKMRGNEINIEKLVSYASRLDIATTKRLGWILDHLDFDFDRFSSLEKREIKGYRKLDPTGPSIGPYNKKWMLQENLSERP